MLAQIDFQYADIDKLIPYAMNSRTHSDEQVAQIAGSIREFGFLVPVLSDINGTIIAGHGRILAARKLGMKQVPVVVAEGLTEAHRTCGRLTGSRPCYLNLHVRPAMPNTRP